MKLGLNLSFAVKRWMEPEQLAEFCAKELRLRHIQFTWDLIDPWWPEKSRRNLAVKFRRAFEKEELMLESSFGGIASYTYGQLLAPDKEQREVSFLFFKRAIDLTEELGASMMGTPVGGLSVSDARNPRRRQYLYEAMLEDMRRLAEYGKEHGLKELHVEPSPVFGEIPYNIRQSLDLMEKLSGTAIPIKLLIDWGHALYRPLLKEEADIRLWFEKCGKYIGSMHLQQTDGMGDRHWDFTKKGIVTPDLILQATKEAGLDQIPQYLEIVTAFEEEDESICQRMKETVSYLKSGLSLI